MIIFDIETKGDRELALSMSPQFKSFEPLPEFDERNVKIGNLKDESKIAEKIEKAREEYPQLAEQHKAQYEKDLVDYNAKIISKSALSATTGIVVAIGIKSENERYIIEGTEKEILSKFWELYSTTPDIFVGFNNVNFDVPFLARRSWANRVSVPSILSGRFLTNRFVDLMQIFACGEYQYKISLDKLCKHLGVEGKYTGKCNGYTFAEKFLSNNEYDRADAEYYLYADIDATWNVAQILLNENNDAEIDSDNSDPIDSMF